MWVYFFTLTTFLRLLKSWSNLPLIESTNYELFIVLYQMSVTSKYASIIILTVTITDFYCLEKRVESLSMDF